jgi:hypothetical protein
MTCVVMDGDLADVRLWASELDAGHEQFVHGFNRSEPRESPPASGAPHTCWPSDPPATTWLPRPWVSSEPVDGGAVPT